MELKLTELCSIQYGYAFDSGCFTDDESYIPLVRIRDVKRGFSETYYSGEYSEEYILHAGDLLIGMDGEFNIARWKSRDALLNQRVCKVAAKEGVCEEYLRFALSIKLKEIENRTAFVTVKHLSAKELNKIEMNIPKRIEQERISDTLKKIEVIIEKRQMELHKLDGLIKARFIELFGDPVANPMEWDKVTIDDCVESIENGKSFVCDGIARTGEAPAILKLSAATYGMYKPEENKAIIDENDFVENAEVHAGDLLFTRKNTPELVGMAAYVFSTPPKLMMPDLIFRINTKQNCRKIYLWKLINHDLFRSQIQSIASGSAKSMSNISKERLGKLRICLPPLDLQIQFEEFVIQVDKSKVKLEHTHLSSCEWIKIFSGRLAFSMCCI